MQAFPRNNRSDRTTYLKDCAHLLLQPELVVGVQHLVKPAAHEVAHCLAVAIDAVVQVTQPEHQVVGLKGIHTPEASAAGQFAAVRFLT
jgi:hypothetical protein